MDTANKMNNINTDQNTPSLHITLTCPATYVEHLLITENCNLKNEHANLRKIYENDLTQAHNQINQYYQTIKKTEEEVKSRDFIISELKQENDNLKKEIELLREKINEQDAKILKLTSTVDMLKNEKQKFDALVKLNECNALVNKHFKLEYKKRFKPNRTERIPNIGDIINDPPNELDDKAYYDFWEDFKKKYPQSDNPKFREIYFRISTDRANNGAHVNINRMSQNDFDKAIAITMPDIYNADIKLCEAYRDWLFLFPLV